MSSCKVLYIFVALSLLFLGLSLASFVEIRPLGPPCSRMPPANSNSYMPPLLEGNPLAGVVLALFSKSPGELAAILRRARALQLIPDKIAQQVDLIIESPAAALEAVCKGSDIKYIYYHQLPHPAWQHLQDYLRAIEVSKGFMVLADEDDLAINNKEAAVSINTINKLQAGDFRALEGVIYKVD